jgi:hypothetical protein
MYALPKEFNTQSDIYNCIGYCSSYPEYKPGLIRMLLDLRDNTTMLVLKDSSTGVDPEEQTPDDFEAVSDPNALLFRLGLTVDKVNQLLEGLGYGA